MENYYLARRRNVILYLLYKHYQKKSYRSCAVRDIFKKRKQEGAYHNLVQEMRLNDVESYFNFLRMMPEDFDNLLSIVGPHLGKHYHSTEPISPPEMLATTLRYLASGESMVSISNLFRLGKSTVSQIIRVVCDSIWAALNEEYLFQPTEKNWENIATGFFGKWNVPNCIGAIDGKHVLIKGDFSILLMALCDADYCFTVVDIGARGRPSDGGIFRHSTFGQMLFGNKLNIPAPKEIVDGEEVLPYFMVADEAFPLSLNIMRPYPGQCLSLQERVFNYRLSRTRQIIENTFGILEANWRIYRKPILAKLDTVEAMVKATICLHNFLRKRDQGQKEDDRRYCRNNLVDREDEDGNRIDGEWRNESHNNLLRIGQVSGNDYSADAANVRERLTEYFMFENTIEPQWNQ